MLFRSDALVDEGSWLEAKPLFAKELVTGFARLDGEVVGIVANNPQHLGGVLFVDSADKAARFVTMIDTFYEKKVKFICSAATAPAGLYVDGDGAFEFQRTVSRLMEMQSPEYLALEHIA